MPDVIFTRFFPSAATPKDACDRIEREIATLKTPKSRGNQVWQRVLKNAVLSYVREARASRSQTKKWRSIAEAMFWWSAAFSLGSDTPYCQAAGAAAQSKGKNKRIALAWKVYRAGNPTTGKPWSSKEACKMHLMATYRWSRTSCTGYLKDENEV